MGQAKRVSYTEHPFRRNLGGDEGDRTPDLCNAIAALSQLSYVPFNFKAPPLRQTSNLTKMAKRVKTPAVICR